MTFIIWSVYKYPSMHLLFSSNQTIYSLHRCQAPCGLKIQSLHWPRFALLQWQDHCHLHSAYYWHSSSFHSPIFSCPMLATVHRLMIHLIRVLRLIVGNWVQVLRHHRGLAVRSIGEGRLFHHRRQPRGSGRVYFLSPVQSCWVNLLIRWYGECCMSH